MKQKKRRKARKYLLQALYSWQISNEKVNIITKEFLKNKKKFDIKYFHELITKITKNYIKIDHFINKFLKRKISKIDQIEKIVLRIAFYELLNRNDIPYKVTINESIELVKKFGAKDSHKFINSILDKAVNKIKILE